MTVSPAAVHAVLFDCDGVLVDSEEITNRLMRDDLAERGLDLPLEQIMSQFVGGTIDSCAEEARQRGADLPDDWVPLIYRKMFAALATDVEAVAGVSRLVDTLLANGIACAVGSNGPFAKMEITLKKTSLWNRFYPHIYSAKDLPRPKPAPDVYLHAASQLSISPDQCVVIEDSVSGARAAHAAGMRCIGFAPHDHQAGLAPHVDVMARDMDEVARHLGF